MKNYQSYLNQRKLSPSMNEIFAFNDLIDFLNVWKQVVLNMASPMELTD